MVFNIGNQQAGVVNNVGHDQHVHDGQSGQVVAGQVELHGLVEDLRQAVDGARLPSAVRPEVRTELTAIEQEAARPEPDKEAMADRLSRITRLLGSAGAAITAGTGLFGAVSALAGWLGTAGRPVLHAIGL
ncbi:hypothetical protein ACFCX4_29555 [Kitasatospora sp. NPDC056327]|uniref:hypothetical protein n=1 Tax=Kitasatospora sp. NPDC056327 TaxID=3345785 RepID=UPI0035DDC5D5